MVVNARICCFRSQKARINGLTTHFYPTLRLDLDQFLKFITFLTHFQTCSVIGNARIYCFMSLDYKKINKKKYWP